MSEKWPNGVEMTDEELQELHIDKVHRNKLVVILPSEPYRGSTHLVVPRRFRKILVRSRWSDVDGDYDGIKLKYGSTNTLFVYSSPKKGWISCDPNDPKKAINIRKKVIGTKYMTEENDLECYHSRLGL